MVAIVPVTLRRPAFILALCSAVPVVVIAGASVSAAAAPVESQTTVTSNIRRLIDISDDGRTAFVDTGVSGSAWATIDTVTSVVTPVAIDLSVDTGATEIHMLANGLGVVVNTNVSLTASDTDSLVDGYLYPLPGGAPTLLTGTLAAGVAHWVTSASADGLVLTVSEGGSIADELLVLDRNTGTTDSMTSRFPGYSGFSGFVSSNGRTVALSIFTNGAPFFSQVLALDRITNTTRKIERGGGIDVVDISADGRRTIGRASIAHLDTGTFQRIFDTTTSAAFAIDGTGERAVVMEVTGTGSSDRHLKLWEAGRSGLTDLTSTVGAAADDVVQMSADGRTVVYSSRVTSFVRDIVVVRLAPRSPTYVPLTPARVLETREGEAPTIDGLFNGVGIRAAGSVTELPVRGRAGVPTDASAVVINVTVTEPAAAGFVTVFPCGTGRPNASNLNYVAGQTVANNVIATVGAGGAVCIFTLATTHLIVDVSGAVPPNSGYRALSPARLVETRAGEAPTIDGQYSGVGRVPTGGTLKFNFYHRGGLGSNVGSLVLNVTAISPSQAGFLTVYRCMDGRPNASSLNYRSGQIVANTVVIGAPLGRFNFPDVPDITDGDICIFSSANADIAVDLNGSFDAVDQYYESGRADEPSGPSGAPLAPLAPARLLETRSGEAPTIDGQFTGIGLVTAPVVLDVAGRGGVPADADAAVLNVTVTAPIDAGFVTVYPCGARPNASNLNFTAGQTVANNVIAPLSASGQVCLFASIGTHLIVDVTGSITA